MKIDPDVMSITFYVLAIKTNGHAFVILDGSHPDVRLPAPFKGEKEVTLEYIVDAPTPITDWSVSVQGIHATLSFGGRPEETFVPWAAVLSMIDPVADRGMIIRGAPPEQPAPKPGLRLVK